MLPQLSQSLLKQRLSYNPDLGEFRWVKSKNWQAPIGSVAGSIQSNGYIRIWLEGKLHAAHRLAWLYCHGYMPPMIDHINGIKHDNRIDNLRPANKALNKLNEEEPHINNALQVRGVHKVWRKYRAKCGVVHLGFFNTPEEASTAYNIERKRQLERAMPDEDYPDDAGNRPYPSADLPLAGAADRDITACLDTISILSRAHADLNGSLTEAGENARKGIEVIIGRYVAALTPDPEEAPPETA